MEFLENVLALFVKRDLVYSQQSRIEDLLFFWFFSEESKYFVDEKKKELHKRELLKYRESFQVLVFEKNLSIETAL